jgi:hypothetical protein
MAVARNIVMTCAMVVVETWQNPSFRLLWVKRENQKRCEQGD